MIYQGSRYAGKDVVAVQSDRGWMLTVYRGDIDLPKPTGEVIAGDGVTLAWMAFKAYGDAELWWHIADANPNLLYPDEIPPGTVVKVPYVSTVR